MFTSSRYVRAHVFREPEDWSVPPCCDMHQPVAGAIRADPALEAVALSTKAEQTNVTEVSRRSAVMQGTGSKLFRAVIGAIGKPGLPVRSIICSQRFIAGKDARLRKPP